MAEVVWCCPLVTSPGLCLLEAVVPCLPPLPPGIVFRGKEEITDIWYLVLWPNLTSC